LSRRCSGAAVEFGDATGRVLRLLCPKLTSRTRYADEAIVVRISPAAMASMPVTRGARGPCRSNGQRVQCWQAVEIIPEVDIASRRTR
jgi:hypothetical protein